MGIYRFKGHNELFINQGDNTFKEESAKYNLDIKSQANNVAFFDYDKDGDLDMYLLNEGHHSQESFGPASNRFKISEANGDRLLRNDNGKFVNVSQQAGIYSGPNSYGLGVAVADFNNDGWDDLYISNDFHEDDYYYINNKNGTFSEQLKSHFGKVSRFSMGNDVADVNNDGYPDIMTLDMMPEEEKYLKSTLTDDDVNYHKKREQLGYYPQFSRNMLQINKVGKYFTDVALFSGVAATDWSWASLWADFNQDGQLDLFVSNGIYKRLNDLDYLQFFTNKAMKQKINTSRLFDQKALDLMPFAAVHNYFFKGSKSLKFEDKSEVWFNKKPTVSSGSAYADLDNDGDLDLVINNFNAKPSVLENTSKNNSFLKIRFKTSSKNSFALGTKVLAYHKNKMQTRQLYTTRGFQSSVEPLLYFGFGKSKTIDSLRIIWPDNTTQLLTNVRTNQTLTISPNKKRQSINYKALFKVPKPWFKALKDSNFTTLKHVENRFSEFSSNPLLPYKLSTQGPAFALTNSLKKERKLLFLGGATHHKSQLFILDSLGIHSQKTAAFDEDKNSEDVEATFFDANNDGFDDLFVVSGGNEFSNNNSVLKDRLYLNDGHNNFVKSEVSLPKYFENGAFVKAKDVDNDGDLDLFVGSRSITNHFGHAPKSYLLLNNGKGNFKIANSVLSDSIGMLTDAVFTDFNKDGTEDLIVVGEWMAPQFYKNVKGKFLNVTKNVASQNNKGLWQAIQPFDIDADGDTDYLLGNWGLNTKFKASKKQPLKLYMGSLKGKTKVKTLVSFAKKGIYYSVNNKDQLQKVFGKDIDAKFKTYKDFAGKSFDDVIDKKWQEQTTLKTVENLASGYLENNNGKFVFKPFEESMQLAPITSFLRDDFNLDGEKEVLATGNLFNVTPYLGKLDGNVGFLIQKGHKITNGIDLGLNLGNVPVKQLKVIRFNNKGYLWVVVKEGKNLIYKILNDN